MNIADYVAAAIIEQSFKRMQAGRRDILYISKNDVVDLFNSYVEKEKIVLKDNVFDDAINIIVKNELLTKLSPPHSSPRFYIERNKIYNLSISISKKDTDEFRLCYWMFEKFGREWLIESLLNSSGYNAPETAEPTRWEPLPIDRPDPKLDETIDTLDKLANDVRSDNGYAATEPAERTEVLSRLDAGVLYLRNAPLITATAIEVYVIWPLQTLLTRFRPETIVGASATLAGKIALDWLKERGIKILDDIFGPTTS